MSDSRVDVQHEFAACVRTIGGIVLDDTIAPDKKANADYWFAREQIIAELKCLREDWISKPKVEKRLTALHASWVHRKLLPPAQRTRIKLNLSSLPEVCALEFLRPIKRRLESQIFGRANAQIKSTKAELDAPGSKGLLLLANDGDYTLTPEMLSYLIMKMLKTNSSINSVIYFSVNVAITFSLHAVPAPFWIEMHVPGRDRVPGNFCEAIRPAWMNHYSVLTSQPVNQIHIPRDPAVLREIKFAKGRTAR